VARVSAILGRFDPATVALDRRIQSDGQQLAVGAGRAFGPRPAGPPKAAVDGVCRTGHHARKSGLGPEKTAGKLFFLFIYFLQKLFTDFCSDFEQISNSFLYSNYSNESLFREFKSYRNFSIKIKVNEFLFKFPLHIVKVNCLNAIKWYLNFERCDKVILKSDYVSVII
jgi:hypothetical protein